jgi:SAM-dependent methyltransferase
MSVGYLIRCMRLPAGASILEFGPGWGLTTLDLIQMGYDVTAVDVNPLFIELIGERARRLDQKVELVCADMQQYRPSRRHDAVLFYECFHHAFDHGRFLERMHTLVAPDGAIVFAGEPISDGFYCPWGVRLDGQAVWSMRKFGWMELGFRETYFRKMLERFGWKTQFHQSLDIPRMSVIVAKRM